MAFNTFFARLDPAGSPLWRNANGFNTTNYANCTALLAIAQDSTQITYAPVAWTAETGYDSPSIVTLVQEQIDDLTNYVPLDSTSGYIGLYVDDGDGTYTATMGISKFRQGYGYEIDPSKDAELDVTWENWGEVRTANGMKYDSVTGEYKYYDY